MVLNQTAVIILLLIAIACCIGAIYFLLRRIHADREWIEGISALAVAKLTAAYGTVPPIEDSRAQMIDLVEAAALHLHNTRQQMEEQNRHLQMLYQLSEQLGQEMSLHGVISVALESIRHAAEIDFVAVLLGENELGPFHFAGIRGSIGDPLSLLDQEYSLPLWGVLAQALVNRPQNDEPDYLVVDDIEAEGRPLAGEFPWDATSGSLMVIPMRHGSKTFGAILIGSGTPHYFNDAIRPYLYAVAGVTTRCIQEAQSRQQAEQWLRQLISLQSLTRTITRTHDLEKIISILHDELVDLFGAAKIGVFLQGMETGTDSKRVRALSEDAGGEESQDIKLYTAALPRPEREKLWTSGVMELVRWVMAAEQPLFFDPANPIADAADLYYQAAGRGLLVPIGEEGTLGVLYLSAPDRPTPFEEGDMLIVRTIAHAAAIAIGTARLHQQIENEAKRQPPALPDSEPKTPVSATAASHRPQ